MVKVQRAYNSIAVLVHGVDLVDAHQVIAEVESFEMTLLTEQDNQRTAGPVQTLTKQGSEITCLLYTSDAADE